jgi:ring-1,2-phenylacetyl-CoA epoxidase subunit PaaD
MSSRSTKTPAAHLPSRQEAAIWALLEQVSDPEIPVLSVVDLGIIRYVRVGPQGVDIGVSPTYTGCPATEVIHEAIRGHLVAAGYTGVRVTTVLSPAWTSDWLTPAARVKLKDYGIAPPAHAVSSTRHLWADPRVECPRCSSDRVERVSEYASTPCKALYRCTKCLEPFEYFKCI